MGCLFSLLDNKTESGIRTLAYRTVAAKQHFLRRKWLFKEKYDQAKGIYHQKQEQTQNWGVNMILSVATM